MRWSLEAITLEGHERNYIKIVSMEDMRQNSNPPKSHPSFIVVSTSAQETPVSNGDSSDANSTPPATPIFQPSALHPDPTVLISITSYMHVPPLQPPPDLQYDLRTFPSPSAEKYASKYDGRGKRAGEGLYVELLGKVEEEVCRRGRELEEEAMKEKAEREAVEEAPKSAVTEASENSEVELVEKMSTLGVEAQGIPPKVLRIGVSSEMGRDRSVAFVEELGRKKWPVEWAVEVLHRDVDRQRGLRKGKARGAEKGGRRKNVTRLTNED